MKHLGVCPQLLGQHSTHWGEATAAAAHIDKVGGKKPVTAEPFLFDFKLWQIWGGNKLKLYRWDRMMRSQFSRTNPFAAKGWCSEGGVEG